MTAESYRKGFLSGTRELLSSWGGGGKGVSLQHKNFSPAAEQNVYMCTQSFHILQSMKENIVISTNKWHQAAQQKCTSSQQNVDGYYTLRT